jgi:hypothetical protein
VVKDVNKVEVRIVVAAVLAAAADAVLVAHHSPKLCVPIWLPHWLTSMYAISREEIARTQEARRRIGAEEKLALSQKVINNSAAVQQKSGSMRLHAYSGKLTFAATYLR